MPELSRTLQRGLSAVAEHLVWNGAKSTSLLDCGLRFVVYISANACTVGSGCMVNWTVEENTNVDNGELRSANTVAACQQECLNTGSCNGFDWNPVNPPGGECWLSGPWSGEKNAGTVPGITHYTLTRTCDRTYILQNRIFVIIIILFIYYATKAAQENREHKHRPT